MADHSLIADHFDDCDRDSDIVDPELEASLYAQIYHRELDFVTSIVEEKNSNDPLEFLDDAHEESPDQNTSVQLLSRDSYYVISDDEANALDETEVTFNYQLTGCSQHFVDECQENAAKRRRKEGDDERKKRFLASDPLERIANFSVREIQKYLGGTPNDWQICSQDLCGGSSGRRYFKTRTIQCKRCSEFGHIAKECTAKIKHLCCYCGDQHVKWRCRKHSYCVICCLPGHTAEKCGDWRRPAEHQTCDRCGLHGHISSECPDQWRQFHSTTSFGEDQRLKRHGVLPASSQKDSRPSYCYNCGHSGHLGHECREPTNYKGRIICFSPFVGFYDKPRTFKSSNDIECSPSQFRQKRMSSFGAVGENLVKKTNQFGSGYFHGSSRESTIVGRRNFDKMKKTLNSHIWFGQKHEDSKNCRPNRRTKFKDDTDVSSGRDTIKQPTTKRRPSSHDSNSESKKTKISDHSNSPKSKKLDKPKRSAARAAKKRKIEEVDDVPTKSGSKSSKRAKKNYFNPSFSWDIQNDGVSRRSAWF